MKFDLSDIKRKYQADLLITTRCCNGADMHCKNIKHHIGILRYYLYRYSTTEKKPEEMAAN